LHDCGLAVASLTGGILIESPTLKTIVSENILGKTVVKGSLLIREHMRGAQSFETSFQAFPPARSTSTSGISIALLFGVANFMTSR